MTRIVLSDGGVSVEEIELTEYLKEREPWNYEDVEPYRCNREE